MKVCKCGADETNSVFRKGRAQCKSCYNIVRRAGSKKKIAIEQALLNKGYKHQWYLDNKKTISAQGKIDYLANRDNRLKKAKENYYANFASSIIRSSKQRAKKMSILFDLDKEFIDEMYRKQEGKCALTGITFTLDQCDYSRRPFAPSLDRIDSNLGYTKDNVRLVCTVVNCALNEFGDDVFDRMCRAYVENFVRSR